MEPHKFNLDDRVIYEPTRIIGRPEWKGSIGTVVQILDVSAFGEAAYRIKWDKDSPYRKEIGRESGVHYEFNLKLLEPPMMQYDPNQQGETDEDI